MKSLQEIIVFTNEKEALQYIVTLVHILQNDRFKLDSSFYIKFINIKEWCPEVWLFILHEKLLLCLEGKISQKASMLLLQGFYIGSRQPDVYLDVLD